MALTHNTSTTDKSGRDHSLERACAVVCDAVADVGFAYSWRLRLRAAELLIRELTQTEPNVQIVRAVAYGRSAILRLGGAPIPGSDTELAHYRHQVGPAMLVLGSDDEQHAVLVIAGSVLMELTLWNDHDDPGVLIRPFVHAPHGIDGPRFVADGVSSGATVAYEVVPNANLEPLNRTYEQIARQLAWNAAPRVRWSLNSPQARKQASA